MRHRLSRTLALLALAAGGPAGAATPQEGGEGSCEQVWIAAYSIAWSHQRDGIGRMFWHVVARGPGPGENDARKVRLALEPVSAEEIDRLADAAYAEPRQPTAEAQASAAQVFADAARDRCRAALR